MRASGTHGAAVRVVTEGVDDASRSATLVLAAALRRIGYRPHLERHFPKAHSWEIAAGDWIADYPSAGDFLDYFLKCANYRP